MAQNIVIGLDIGSHSIKGVAGMLQKNGEYKFLKLFRSPSAGIRKGMVVDMEEASGALSRAIEGVRGISSRSLRRVIVGLGSAQTEVKSSKGFVVVSRGDDVISQEDVDRVIQASQAINLPSNRSIVHVLPREFIVDGIGDIRDPIGLSGARLEVESFIVHAFAPVITNLHRCAEEAGFKIFGLVFGPMAAAKPVLSKAQMDLGVVFIDFGASTTSLAVFEEGKLLHAKVFPVGAANITNDIGVGLKIPVEIAEKLKLSFGFAQSREVSRKDTVDLAKIAPGLDGIVSRRFISEIIESRLAQMADLVNKELKDLGRYAKLPGGGVFVGGGAKMPGMVDFMREELRLPTQIGVPAVSGLPSAALGGGESRGRDIGGHFDDPDMALAFGLFLSDVDDRAKNSTDAGIAKTGTGMLKFLKQFLP